jgi:hypothetical protein
MRRSRVLAVGAVALFALSACGASGDAPPSGGEPTRGGEVASLATPEVERTGSAQPKSTRPRERLDTTPEEYEAMLEPYNKCMREHGGLTKEEERRRSAPDDPASRPLSAAESERSDEANRICEPQFLPLPPWEKDPANPEARDFTLETVKCLKAKGVKYVAVSDDGISIEFGGEQNDRRSISMGLDLAPACEREVAARTR